MAHVKGINWEIIHELLLDEYKRRESDEALPPEVRQWWLDELNRMNDIAVKKALEQD